MVWRIGIIESEREGDEALAILDTISNELKQTFQSAEDFSDLLITKGLMGKFSGFRETARDYIALADYADDYIRNREVVKSILLIRNGRTVFERGPALDSDIYPYPDDIEQAETEKSYWASPRQMNYFFIKEYLDNEILPFYKLISYNDSPSVFAFIGFDEAKLFERYKAYNRGSFFLLREDFVILSSTEKGTIMTSYPADLTQHIKGESGRFRVRNNMNIAYTKTYQDWYLINHTPRNFNANIIGYFVTILFAVILGIFFTFRRLNDIVYEVYITKIYNQEVTLKMITSQINPHFLYNTLDSIRWKALQNKDAEVGRQIEALANMFRHILSKGNNIVTIGQELTQLETYIYIMNFRYGNRIQCTIIASDDVKQIKVPKLILQPIVENAILHGIEPKIHNGEIVVRIEIRENILYISISDNGCGTDAAAINDKLKNHEVSDNVFALKNIDQRIKLLYGENWGLRFESTIGEGTVVTLIMPTGENNETFNIGR
jgi:two-component system sensor histidine kinase YesM